MNEARSTRSFFVTKEIARSVVREIAANPNNVYGWEFRVWQRENPEVFALVGARIMEGSDYIEGVAWAHRILRLQAVADRVTLPKVLESTRLAIMQPLKDKQAQVTETLYREGFAEGFSMRDYFCMLGGQLAKDEPELAAAMDEVAKYRRDKSGILGGAGEVYYLLRSAGAPFVIEASSIFNERIN